MVERLFSTESEVSSQKFALLILARVILIEGFVQSARLFMERLRHRGTAGRSSPRTRLESERMGFS